MYKNRSKEYLVKYLSMLLHLNLNARFSIGVSMENDVKKTKAIRLDNSTLFDIHKLSEYKEVDICVAYLFNILSKKLINLNEKIHLKISPN